MATVVNKDFKVKNGLIVEGTTGTIDNFDILTKKEEDQDYIVGLIGGTATPNNTPDTVVKRDGNGDFAAGTVTANRITFGESGYIEHDGDGDIDIVATGDDVRITADDVRLNAVDDIILSAGDQGSVDGDVVLTTSGGNIRLDAEHVYVGSNEVDSERVATRGYVDSAESDAIASANSATDTKLTEYTKTVDLDTTVDGYGYLKSADLTGYATEAYADQAETDAKAYTDVREAAITTAYQAYADTAEQDAKDYADNLINDASNLSTEVWSAYKTSTEIGLAQAAAEQHADDAVAALVDSAPAMLDTLNELAAALQDNPDVITDLQSVAAGKQDALTAGANIDIINNVISVTGLDSADISDFSAAALSATSAAYDPAGSASTAQSNAESFATTAANNAQSNAEDYADGLAVNYDAAGSASAAQTAAEGYASGLDSATNTRIDNLSTSNVAEGTNLYYTDARAKAEAATLLANATKTNIVITKDGSNNLTITAENGVADSDTDDLTEGSSNLYFTDARAVSALEAVTPDFPAVEIASVAKQVAAQATVATASTNTAVSWAKADFRSAEFLVKIANGTHTEVSKVILTLDTSDNVAMTEYAMVGTNGSLGSVSADVSGNDVRLRVTTGNNNSTVAVVGTLLV